MQWGFRELTTWGRFWEFTTWGRSKSGKGLRDFSGEQGAGEFFSSAIRHFPQSKRPTTPRRGRAPTQRPATTTVAMTTTNSLATTLTTADSDVTTMTTTMTPFVADDGSDDDSDDPTTETTMLIGLANYRVAAKELPAIRRVLEPQIILGLQQKSSLQPAVSLSLKLRRPNWVRTGGRTQRGRPMNPPSRNPHGLI